MPHERFTVTVKRVLLLGLFVFSGTWARAEPREFRPIWEGQHPDAASWTAITESAYDRIARGLPDGAQDVQGFCPKFHSLDESHRRAFWIQLIAAIVKYESGFRPELRFVEREMGIDPVTGKQVVSEGLLQLSYQDERTYKSKVPAGVCDFDYPGDQRYPLKDLRRSILNPENNLVCGLGILDFQIRRHKRIVIAKGAYWAVIKSNSRYSRVPEIKRITKSLEFCQ